MKKIPLLVCIVLIGIIFSLPSPVHAAKKRVRTVKTAAAPAAGGAGVTYSSARLSRPSNSIVVTFLHLDRVKRINYMLSYASRGMQQGAGGAVVPSGQIQDSRDLYFGTCSHGVCTPHYNITNATLTITTILNTGATNVKRYRIKI